MNGPGPVGRSGPGRAGWPPELRRWVERFGGGSGRTGEAVPALEALRALHEALGRPGRDREGAFALLAADALVTEAVERLAGGPAFEDELVRLLEEITAAEAPGARDVE